MTRRTDDTPAPDLSWRSATAALTAVAARDAKRGARASARASAQAARASARAAGRGAKGLGADWYRAPVHHGATALVALGILALFVAIQSILGHVARADDGPAPIPDAAVAATAAAEYAARPSPDVKAIDTPEPEPGTQTGDVGAAPADLLPAVARWWPQIVAAAEAHGVPPRLFACLVTAESSGDSLAQSNFQYQDPVTGAWRTEHAYGLAQIAWVYHTDYDIARGKADPAYNLDYGAAYLAELLADTGGDMATALHRYNGNGRYNGYVAGINRCDERGA